MYPDPNVPRHGKFLFLSPIARGYLWVSYPQTSQLLGGFFTTHFEKYYNQNGFIFPKDRGENKKYLKPQPGHVQDI